jgi:hypothetical protein
MTAVVTPDGNSGHQYSSCRNPLRVELLLISGRREITKPFLTSHPVIEDFDVLSKAGTILPTLGYVLAANIDSPVFKKACTLALAGETTVKELEKLFASAKAVKTEKKPSAMNFTRRRQTLQNWRTVIEKDYSKYGQEELQKLKDELRTLTDLVDAQLRKTADNE